MPLRDILPFGKRNNPFESWPSAPKVRPIVAGRMQGEALDSPTFSRVKRGGVPYPAALVIALGEVGEKTLGLMSEKIAQSNGGDKSALRALLIKETPASLNLAGWAVRALELQSPSMLIVSKSAINAKRFKSVALFQQALNYRKYQEWLMENLLDLGSGVRVFIIGSLDEPIVGILGELIQILRSFPGSMGKPGLLAHVAALLSVRSFSENRLSQAEAFAALREIERFTFSGPHQMKVSYGGEQVIDSALLDGLFILEDPFDKKPASEETTERILADSLFTLVHPSSQKIWEDLNADMSTSGRIRHDYRETVVHSLGIATLYIPVNQIKRYAAARLASAALIGERPNMDEGIALEKSATSERPDITARRFIENGPYLHPVFGWILEASSPAYFDMVPHLDQEFVAAFQSQISHALVHALNQMPADLSHLCLSLEWLEKHFFNCKTWFHSSAPQDANSPERISFQYILAKWHESAQDLRKEVLAWKQSFSPAAASGVSSQASSPVSSAISDWRKSVNPPGWNEGRENGIAIVGKNLPAMLNTLRNNAEKDLQAGIQDPIYRSVALDSTDDVKAMEAYYAESVRPELSRFTNDPGLLFSRIRDRLEWWIRISPDNAPQLYLVCWPPQAGVESEPPAAYCFKADQASNLVNAVYNLALSQTAFIETELAGAWFQRRVNQSVDFLRRAGDAYLIYDQNRASMVNNSAMRRSYLISRDQSLNRELAPFVFSETPRSEIKELDQGEPSRFSAVTFRLNIPLETVKAFQDIRHEYIEKSPEKLHLYAQEQIAVNYEKRIWKLERTRLLLSPDFVSLLASQDLVTIFCQAFISRIIRPNRDTEGQYLSWKVVSMENFPELELAPVEGDGLLTAFRRFVLELPNDPDVTLNPHNHFHPSRRAQYLNLIRRHAKDNALNSEAHGSRDAIKGELEYWKARGEQDTLARSFHVILQCELDEPVWKDW